MNTAGLGGDGSTAGRRTGTGATILAAAIITMTDTIGAIGKADIAHKMTHVVAGGLLASGVNRLGRRDRSDTGTEIGALTPRSADMVFNGTRINLSIFTGL
jgi:hypothetical protein